MDRPQDYESCYWSSNLHASTMFCIYLSALTMGNRETLLHGKRTKDDEFYTTRYEIEKELSNYTPHFIGKVVLCNCDNPYESEFVKFFLDNFKSLGLEKLIAYGLQNPHSTVLIKAKGCDVKYQKMTGNGDFRNKECIAYLEQSDIVVTNPPFSLFREFIDQLIEYGKHFIIIGNQNAITYKEIFRLLKNDAVWLGYHQGDMAFRVPSDSQPRETRYWVDKHGQKWRSLGNVCWFTNVDIPKRHLNLPLHKVSSVASYAHFDNFNALNVDKIKDIPDVESELIGVPITFMAHYNPNQFEIVDALNRYAVMDSQGTNQKVKSLKSHTCNVNGKPTYFRIIIRKKA